MEVRTADQKKCSRFNQYLAVVVVNILALVYGVIMGWCSPVLPLLQSKENPVGSEPMSDSSASWLGSLMCVGALAATPAYGYLCKKHSRKMVGYVIGVIGVAGWLLTVLATSEAMLLSSRIVLGFVASGSTIVSTLYIVECVDDDIRGSMGSMINLFVCAGVLFSYIAGSYLSYTTFNIVCTAITVAFLLAFWWMPETPPYLESIGKVSEAEKVRRWLMLKEKVPVSELSTISEKDVAAASTGSKSFLAEAISSKGIRKAILISIGIVLNNQLSGIMAVVSYTVKIFQASGSDMSPNVSTILVGTLQLSAVYLTSFLVDRVGRKVLLLGSNSTITICLTLLGVFFYLKNSGHNVSSLGWLPVTSLCIFVVAFAMGSGTLSFVLFGEIFPPHIKDVAVTSCICFLNLMSFIVARFFMTLVDVLGMSGCFWFFAVCCLMSVVFSHFFVPETKNRSIESIFEELNGGVKTKMTLKKPDVV